MAHFLVPSGLCRANHMKFTRYDKTSMNVKLGSMEWKVSPNVNFYLLPQPDDFITIDVEFISDFKTSNLWRIETEVFLRLSHNHWEKKIERKMDCTFDTCSRKFNFGSFWTMREIASTERFNREITELSLYAEIQIKSIVGIQILKTTNCQFEINTDSEVVLKWINEHYKSYADKNALMAFSPIFCKMLSDGGNEIERIEKGDLEDFIVFLHLLYGEKSPVTQGNVEGILKLAELYDVQFIISDIEDLLISSQQFTNDHKLRIAELFALSKLQVETMKKQSINEKFEGFTMENIITMSSETIEAHLMKMCNGYEE